MVLLLLQDRLLVIEDSNELPVTDEVPLVTNIRDRDTGPNENEVVSVHHTRQYATPDFFKADYTPTYFNENFITKVSQLEAGKWRVCLR